MQQVQDKTGNNRIEVARTARIFDSFVVNGSDNTVIMKDGARFKNGKISVRGRNNTLVIGENVRFNGFIRIVADGATIEIGDGTTFMGAVLSAHEAATIRIGKDCMFSDHIQVHASDMHSIHDMETGARLNTASDITLGDHVWIGTRVYISKGSTIGSGSVIGAASLVSGTIPSNVVAAGTPARVMREKIEWSRKLMDQIDPRSYGVEDVEDDEFGAQLAASQLLSVAPSHLKLVQNA